MSKSIVGGVVVAGALVFVAFAVSSAQVFDSLKEICEIPAAHKYCEEGGGCTLISGEHLTFNEMNEQARLAEAYAMGMAEGKRQAEEAAGKK